MISEQGENTKNYQTEQFSIGGGTPFKKIKIKIKLDISNCKL